MKENPNRLIIYKYQIEWKVFDSVGNQIDQNGRPFETKEQAEEFVQKLKRSTPRENNINVLIRELKGNEIIRRYKKTSGKKNYQRR